MKPPLVIVKPDRSIPKPARQPAERHDYTPPEVASPLTVAQRWLGARLQDRGDRGYYLDGQPVKLHAIMRATNRVLKSCGMDQVGRDAGWLV